MNKFLTKRNLTILTYISLFVIFIFGFLVRTYKIENPIADWHSWRQADTASVTRNFIKDGFNPFFPQYDALNPCRFV